MFSHAFSDAVFDGFGYPRGSKRVPKGGPKSVKNQSKIELGAETRFGPVLGPIWGRFSSNSGTFSEELADSSRWQQIAADSSR